MITRRQTFFVAAALALAAPFAAQAAAPLVYAKQQFEQAKSAGGPVLVHINATWCPTCQAQKPIISKLLEDKRFKKFMAFQVDYDSEKDAMRAMNAPDRSTIIVYKGGKEVGRSVGDTTEDKIEALLEKGA